MAMIMSKAYAYSKMELEDAEEIHHRRAQFLIYKTLEKADIAASCSSRRSSRPSWLKVRLSKLKIKIGRRMKRLKKCFFSAAKRGVHRQLKIQSTAWKRFFGVREAAADLPPMFT